MGCRRSRRRRRLYTAFIWFEVLGPDFPARPTKAILSLLVNQTGLRKKNSEPLFGWIRMHYKMMFLPHHSSRRNGLEQWSIKFSTWTPQYRSYTQGAPFLEQQCLSGLGNQLFCLLVAEERWPRCLQFFSLNCGWNHYIYASRGCWWGCWLLKQSFLGFSKGGPEPAPPTLVGQECSTPLHYRHCLIERNVLNNSKKHAVDWLISFRSQCLLQVLLSLSKKKSDPYTLWIP